MQALELVDNPTAEVLEAMADLEALAESGGSLARRDLEQEDGSVLVVSSFQGRPAELQAAEDVDAAGVLQVEAPRTDDSPPPQGVGDDGVLRDETGTEVSA